MEVVIGLACCFSPLALLYLWYFIGDKQERERRRKERALNKNYKASLYHQDLEWGCTYSVRALQKRFFLMHSMPCKCKRLTYTGRMYSDPDTFVCTDHQHNVLAYRKVW